MRIYIARKRPQRQALYLPMGGTKENPSLMFFLPQTRNTQVSPTHLDELVRAQLEKQGVTKEADIHAIVEKAEADYEQRIKMAEVHKEAQRLMALRAQGLKLMSIGFRKWREVFHPAIKQKTG